jgi:RNA polymerase sigma-70 factor (ECF subfamily)
MEDQSLNDKGMLESSDNFESAYRSHSKAIYNFLFWRTKNVQLAEDLTSKTFEKAWASRKSFHGGSVQAWFYRIARNVLIDYWRVNKELAVDDIDGLHQSSSLKTEEIVHAKLELESLQVAVNKLPNDMRLVVTLRFIEGMSCKQVAKRLGLSDSNVRVIQYRALKKLKSSIR